MTRLLRFLAFVGMVLIFGVSRLARHRHNSPARRWWDDIWDDIWNGISESGEGTRRAVAGNLADPGVVGEPIESETGQTESSGLECVLKEAAMKKILLLVLLVAADAAAQDVRAAIETTDGQELVIVVPPALLQLPQTPPPTSPAQKTDMTTPTLFFVSSAAVDWGTGASACDGGCRSRSGSLPTVQNAKLSVPLGLAVDAATLWLCHEILARRWPKVAQAVLYGLSIVRAVNASDHVTTQRRRNRGL